MAKLNKSEVVAAMKAAAAKNPIANALTLADLDAMPWDARRQLAYKLADEAGVADADTHKQYLPAAREAYVDAIMGIWSSKVKSRDNARRAWRSALTGITTDQAADKIASIVDSFHLRGLNTGYRDRMTVDVSRPSGAAGTVYFRYDRDYDKKLVNPDDPKQAVFDYTLTVSFSWSSSQRSMAGAIANVKLYGELIEVAAEVEAAMSNVRVISTWGIPEEVKEQPAVDNTTTEAVV